MLKKTAFITGVAGQDGAYLADFLIKKKYHVIGLTTSTDKSHFWRLDFFGIREKVQSIFGDICDYELIKKIIVRYKPQEIYNLAGQSSVAQSWKDPIVTFEINAVAVLKMLEILRLHSPKSRFFQASSAEIYGNTQSIRTEDSAFNPLNPYANSKLAAHLAVNEYREQYRVYVCNGILFTHTSPLQIESTVAKKIIRSAVKIFYKRGMHISLGDITIARDWTYASDIVEGMWLMLQQKKPNDYIVSSGQRRTIKDFVFEACRNLKIKNCKRHLLIDQNFIRKNDIIDMHGSNKRLKSIGWKPKVTFTKLVKQMIEYELDRYKKD